MVVPVQEVFCIWWKSYGISVIQNLVITVFSIPLFVRSAVRKFKYSTFSTLFCKDSGTLLCHVNISPQWPVAAVLSFEEVKGAIVWAANFFGSGFNTDFRQLGRIPERTSRRHCCCQIFQLSLIRSLMIRVQLGNRICYLFHELSSDLSCSHSQQDFFLSVMY